MMDMIVIMKDGSELYFISVTSDRDALTLYKQLQASNSQVTGYYLED